MKKIIGLILGIGIGISFVTIVWAGLDTQLGVDLSASSGNVPYNQSQWYRYNAEAGKGYCITVTPLTGNPNLYLLDPGFARVGYSTNSGLTKDQIWYGRSSAGIMHLGIFGAYNPSSNYTVSVITSPYISSISPTSGTVNTLVTINGYGFGATQGTSYVMVGAVKATSYTLWSNTQIKAYVPSGITSGTLKATVYVNSRTSNGLNFVANVVISSDGAMYRYDLGRTGNYPNGPTTFPLNLKWSYNFIDDVQTSIVRNAPTIVNNVLYIGGNNKLYAFDVTTGSVKWSYVGNRSTCQFYSSSAVVGNIIYIGGWNAFYAFDAVTGLLKWKYDVKGYCTSPIVYNGIVYFGCQSLLIDPNSIFYALDANTGALKWVYNFRPGASFSTPTIFNGMVYFVVSPEIYALDVNNGAVKWIYSMPEQKSNDTPVVSNGILYLSTIDIVWGDMLYALDANTGTLKWRYSAVSIDTPAVANGLLYFKGNTYIGALDVNTGVERWQSGYLGQGGSICTISSGLLYIVQQYKMLVLDANTGIEKWSYTPVETGAYFESGKESAPVVYSGKVYFLGYNTQTRQGKLYCFGQ